MTPGVQGAMPQSVPNFCAPFMSTLCSLLSISYSACATTGKLRNIIEQKKCMKLLIKVKLDFLTRSFNIHFSKPDCNEGRHSFNWCQGVLTPDLI